jgi:hypothetical protein
MWRCKITDSKTVQTVGYPPDFHSAGYGLKLVVLLIHSRRFLGWCLDRGAQIGGNAVRLYLDRIPTMLLGLLTELLCVSPQFLRLNAFN